MLAMHHGSACCLPLPVLHCMHPWLLQLLLHLSLLLLPPPCYGRWHSVARVECVGTAPLPLLRCVLARAGRASRCGDGVQAAVGAHHKRLSRSTLHGGARSRMWWPTHRRLLLRRLWRGRVMTAGTEARASTSTEEGGCCSPLLLLL